MEVGDNSNCSVCEQEREVVGVIPQLRPSLFDAAPGLDAWLERCPGSHLYAVFLQNRPVSLLAASTFDEMTLNHLLTLFQQRPTPVRRRPCSG